MRIRQLAAIAAILCFAAALALAVVVFARHFWVGVLALACVLLAIGAAWYGVRRRGAAPVVGLAAAVLLLAASLLITHKNGLLLVGTLGGAALVASILCARAAFLVHVELPTAPAPQRAVLFFNPKSGGGKAERFNLADEARARRIEPVELKKGDDLAELVAAAIGRGADGLAMAGGDGSQALVAAAAAERDLPYACIPAGTRNHFALDLGVDRDDVVGALDAFVDGGERRVDLAEVNGKVFVNNVSLGLYAEAVQRSATGRRSCARSSRRCRRCSAPAASISTCAGGLPAARGTTRARSCSSPTIATGSGAPSAQAPARGSTTVSWGLR